MKHLIRVLAGVVLCSNVASAQLSVVANDNGVYGNRPSNTNTRYEESVMLKPKGPCALEYIVVYYADTLKGLDTLYIQGDPSEGFISPSSHVWHYNLLTDPIVFQTKGKGWDTIDVRDRRLHYDGFDRIVITHHNRIKGPRWGFDKDKLSYPPMSYRYTASPEKYLLASADWMVRALVRYDLPEGDSSAAPPAPSFVDKAIEAGIKNADGTRIFADRIAVADWNSDSYDDIAIGSRFFENKKNGTFEEVSTKINIGASTTVWGDFDNDGHLDCFAAVGMGGDKLYRNNGDGTFTDVTVNSGIENNAPTVTPIWLDYDHDGWIDLFISNGRTGDFPNEVYYVDQLWQNNKDGSFSNVTESSGLADAEIDPYDCWGASAVDYNNDSWPDLFVNNYRLAPDFLHKNLGDGSFEEVGELTGTRGLETEDSRYFGHGMGSDWGDFNNDGRMDLAIGNLGHPDSRGRVSNPSLIFRNDGETFTEVHQEMGLKFFEMNAGSFWADFNADGYLDLWHCQYSYYHFNDTVSHTREPYRYSRIYINEGPEKNFHLADSTWHFGPYIHGSWTAARGDFDNDGYMDIIAISGKRTEGAKLFMNELANAGRSINIRLKGEPSKGVPMDAYGSSATAFVDEKRFTRQLTGGGGGITGSQNSSVLNFGVGTAARIDSLVIRYPNNKIQILRDLATNQSLTVPYAEHGTASVTGTVAMHSLDAKYQGGRLSYTYETPHTAFLLNAAGQRIFETKLDEFGRNRVLRVGDLPAGFYLLRISEGTQVRTQPVVIIK